MTPVDEQRIFDIGSEILERARAAEPRFYETDFWAQLAMDWTVQDPWLKTQLFRFVQVLPTPPFPDQPGTGLRPDSQFALRFTEPQIHAE